MKNIKFSVLAMSVFMAIAFVFTGCHKTPINLGTTPTVTTGSASKITKNSAVLSGTVVNNGGHQISEEGFYFSSNGDPTDQSPQIIGRGSTFTCNLESLDMNTTYYYMAYAINKLGTSYGSVKSFTTNERDAVLTVVGDSALTMTSVVMKVKINPYGSTITSAGVCYSTSDPTTSDSKVTTKTINGINNISLTGLKANTHYYVRAYAITSTGTLYSPKYEVWTYAVMDYDNNGYHSVTIGNQTFTVENYRCTHYLNGDLIPNVKDNKFWSTGPESGLATGARCYYDNDSSKYDSVYGALYNGYAVSDPRGFAPKGWHLPTSNEIDDLALHIGGINSGLTAGGKIKEVGTTHWKSPNTGADNSTGFTALPGGDRADNRKGDIGAFNDLTTDAIWWEGDQQSPTYRWSFYVSYNNTAFNVAVSFDKWCGFSVRLIKNQ